MLIGGVVVVVCSFSLGETESGSGQCVGAIAGQDLGLGDNVWLLGDRYALFPTQFFPLLTEPQSFMKNVYSVFSFEQNAVGFAALS